MTEPTPQYQANGSAPTAEPMPRRAFQGWRYLEAADSPRDLPTARKGDDRLPEPLALALAEIGLR